MLFGSKRALVLGAHTDGEFGCSGPIARLIEIGTEVPLAGIAADDAGPIVEGLAGEGGFDHRRVVVIGSGVGVAALPAGWTALDPASRHIRGTADAHSERFVNELRRYGIRFYSRPSGEVYVDWETEPPSFAGPTEGSSERASER